MKTLNLGWGIQSFTLAAMVALGELEPIDAAIHADTTHERESTYRFAEKYTPWLEAHGVRVITVRDAVQPEQVMTSKTDIPAFTVGMSINGGMLRRQCTGRWKITPIRKWLREERNRKLEIKKAMRLFYGLDPNQEQIEHVEQWLGISLDEAERMKPSDVKYITHRWPLIEKRMSRNACIAWLARHNLDIPDKSACVFCPFHNRSAWWAMKSEGGADWQKAVAVDEAIRKARPPFDLFVHADRIPLADIRSPQDDGQLELWSEECSGTCFV